MELRNYRVAKIIRRSRSSDGRNRDARRSLPRAARLGPEAQNLVALSKGIPDSLLSSRSLVRIQARSPMFSMS
jgi:hypothetical protein